MKGPVILTFGLIRPYKGTDVLLEAFARVRGAELWIVGMPRMPMEPLQELAARAPGTVRFVDRFVTDQEIPAFMRRADIVALPIGTSSSRASSIRRSPSAVPWCCQMSVASPRSRSWARPDWPRSGTPRRLPRCSKACSTIPPSASGRRRRLGGGPRHLLLGRDRPRDPRPLPTAAGPIIPCCGARDRLLGGRRPDRLRPPRLSAPPLGAGEAVRRGRVGVRVAGELPRVTLIVPAYDEQAVIERRVANALELDYPRERLQLIVASDGSSDRTAELGPRGRRRPGPGAAAGRQGGGAGRRRPRGRGPGPRLLRRQRPLAPRFAPPAARPPCRRAGGLRLRPGPLPWRRGRKPGGPLLALRDGRARARVQPRRGDRGQWGDLRGPPRGLPRARPEPGSGHLLSLRVDQARLARGLRARRPCRGADGADGGGRIPPQAADDVGLSGT